MDLVAMRAAMDAEPNEVLKLEHAEEYAKALEAELVKVTSNDDLFDGKPRAQTVYQLEALDTAVEDTEIELGRLRTEFEPMGAEGIRKLDELAGRLAAMAEKIRAFIG